MTQEEKQLLLKDLCARLPYRVKINIKSDYTREMEDTELTPYHLDGLGYNAEYRNLRPYLRPMSSMTEEEYKSVSWEGCSHTFDYSLKFGFRFVEIKTFTLNILDWFNEHHFDFRGLIEKGLALEATEEMYKIE